MQRSADTHLVMFHRSGSAPADAGRWAAGGGTRGLKMWGRVSREKKVAGRARGVVWFLCRRRELRVMWVARSALSRRWVAAQQAHAPDRGHDGFHISQSGCAAGDARRYASSSLVNDAENQSHE